MSKTKIDKTVPVTVVAVERNLTGSIDKYKLSNGKIIERDKMVIPVSYTHLTLPTILTV